MQLIGRRLQEEKILALTEMIGDALGKHVVCERRLGNTEQPARIGKSNSI